MNYIEYAIYDLDFTEEEFKKNIEAAILNGVQCISVPFAYTKYAKTIAKDSNVLIANPIDYPLGISDIKSRNEAVVNAIENGAEKIEIVMQNNYLNMKKYDKLRQDIKSNAEICEKYKIPINYYLEYRVFTHQSLIKACHLLLEIPINTVYVSTGYMLDNLDDNIIATVLLKQKSNIHTIFTGNIWNKSQVELLNKNNIDFLRLNTINGIITYNKYKKQ